MIRNQKGLTLIEVLLTIAILSIVGGLIWSIFFQGTTYSNNAMTKNEMQQEGNILLSKMVKIHQTSLNYRITNVNNKINIIYQSKNNTSQSEEFENSKMNYSIMIQDQLGDDMIGELIDPSIDNIYLTISIVDKKNAKNKTQLKVFYIG